MIAEPHLILASNSPRRKQLFELLKRPYTVVVSDVDESQIPDEAPREYVLRLAVEKAMVAARDASAKQIVVAADTAVIDGRQILGKPRDKAEAERMLKQLRGGTHQVFTGLAVYRAGDAGLFTEICVTDVPMRSYSDAEITTYVDSRDPLDKAGAYAIQHAGFQPVESMQGCFASVMGLPLCHLVRTLKKIDVDPRADVPPACQSLLKYECPVSDAILRGETLG